MADNDLKRIDRGLLLRIVTNLVVNRSDKGAEKIDGLMVRFSDGMIGNVDTGKIVQYIADEYDNDGGNVGSHDT